MNTYDKIVELLELGTLAGVGVQRKDGWWKAFTHISAEGGLYGCRIAITLEGSVKVGPSSNMYFKDEIEEYFTSNIVPVPRKPKVLNVGTKVRVLEVAREMGDYNHRDDEIDKIINTVGEVIQVIDSTNGIRYCVKNTTGDALWLPFYCIIPAYEDDITEMTMKDIADKLGVSVENLRIKD